MASRLTHRKRRAQIAPSDADDGAAAVESAILELSELRLWRSLLLTPEEPAAASDLSTADEKVQLGRRLWSGGYLESMTMLRGVCIADLRKQRVCQAAPKPRSLRPCRCFCDLQRREEQAASQPRPECALIAR